MCFTPKIWAYWCVLLQRFEVHLTLMIDPSLMWISGCGFLSSFTTPSLECWSHPDSFFPSSFVLYFSFILHSYVEAFLPFLEFNGLLQAFSSSSVWIILHVGFFFFNMFVGEDEYIRRFFFNIWLNPAVNPPFSMLFHEKILIANSSSLLISHSNFLLLCPYKNILISSN